MFRRLGSALLAGCCAIGVSALPAAAASVKCGDRISTDIVLTKNLACSGDALHIVVPRGSTVRVNLNGHSITGNGTGTAFETVLFKPQGSAIPGNLMVSGGTVSGFASVVVGLAGTGGVGLENLTFTRLILKSNTTWLPIRVMDDVLVENSNFADTGKGGAYTDGGGTGTGPTRVTNNLAVGERGLGPEHPRSHRRRRERRLGQWQCSPVRRCGLQRQPASDVTRRGPGR